METREKEDEEEEEDFSFPTTTSSSRFIESPPLWPLSSPSLSDSDNNNNNNDREAHQKAEEDGSCSCSSEEEEEEEKMDMLWEDFNEEDGLLKSKTTITRRKCDYQIQKMDDDDQLGCVKALTVSKTGGTMVSSRKRPSLVMFVKVFKKLFLLHNNSHPCP